MSDKEFLEMMADRLEHLSEKAFGAPLAKDKTYIKILNGIAEKQVFNER